MNDIRKAVQSLQSMLAMVVLVCVSSVSFTACSDDDETVEEVTYSWEFEEVSASTPDFMDDKNKIESAFKTALGASESATSVTKQGTSETCDQEVLEACQRAFDSLKDEVWQGRYVFVVTNVTTGAVIFIHTFNADNENRGTYTTSDLKIGDYYYSDGTWSDGGLREIKPLAAPNNTSGWFLPSIGQLLHLQKNRSFLEAHIEIVRDNTTDGCSYKEYIKGFNDEHANGVWTPLYYWSSTESDKSLEPENTWILDFNHGLALRVMKDYTAFVRAVLAF